MIALPWPPKELNPNHKAAHWSTKARITKATRTTAAWLTKASGEKVTREGKIDVHITFCPPDKRKRDMDGMLSSCKASLDGLADGLGVNDNRFRLHLEIGEVVAGGLVKVSVL